MWGAIASILGGLMGGQQKHDPAVQQKQGTPVNADFTSSNYGDLIKQMLLQNKASVGGY